MISLSNRNELHLTRKIWHILTGLIALFITFKLKLDSREASLVSGTIGLFGLIGELLRLNIPRVNEMVFAKIGFLFREHEKKRPSGLVFYALGVSVTFYLYSWNVAIISILILVFADPFASLFGVLFGKRKLFKQKSLAGFMGCLAVSTLTTYIYSFYNGLELKLGFLLLIGLFGALSELFTIIDDNLSIPIVSGALISLII
jgi:diacylglycerol kinase (CTP)